MFLESIAKQFEGYYILPSSIHEVIAIPGDLGDSCDTIALKKIVHEVNTTQVEPPDFLSDHVYKIIDGKVAVAL